MDYFRLCPVLKSKNSLFLNISPVRRCSHPTIYTRQWGLNAARISCPLYMPINLQQKQSFSACLKIRPVRGPGLHEVEILAVSCRPRALTRRFGGIFKTGNCRMW
jgi:hypothetical protein